MNSITQKGYIIQPISHKLADSFLIRHHYLAQQGNGFLSKENYGLFRHLGGGIAWSNYI